MQYSVVFRTWILISYTFRPKTSVCSKKVAVDFTFVNPLYRGRVGVDYKVFHVAASCVFTAFFYCRFYLRSAHLAISIVDLYLC